MQDLQQFFLSVNVHYMFVVFIQFLNTARFSKTKNILAIFIQVK